MGAERDRLISAPHELARWRKWGPYLADRSWGTVREDYSADADPWRYFPHDHARSKAYRWGEDGIAGWCDRYQILCFALAVWNGRDPILKERYFGLVPDEANHGEDAKEVWFHVDGLPSHAYSRLLYKYPHAEFPYVRLIEENRGRGRERNEFELIDTGVFDEGRYFDVDVEIAKADPDRLAIRITTHNRGPERAPIHLIPQLWFRNTWSWGAEPMPQPVIRATEGGLLADDTPAGPLRGLTHDSRLGPHVLEVPEGARLLFTDNETNVPRVYGSGTSKSAFTKDAFHRCIINGERGAVNPEQRGTKACAWMQFDVDAGASATVKLVLRPAMSERVDVDEVIELRKREADEFYDSIHPARATAEERNVQRQAFAGLIATKQSYLFDVDVWLDGDDPRFPPPGSRHAGRNARWRHLNSMRILSMPDKWEYPWFAAWDLAFHSVVFALIDGDYAKEQLWLMLFEQFQHPNGQIPAYEWEFSDLNPPVQAWAVWRVYNMDRIRHAHADVAFLEKCFHKLMLNFTWWVNKVDAEGNNVFEGGFLGLDNITLLDRSRPLPHGARLEQSDATGWMGMFCLVMMRIALELSKTNKVYEGLATKFFEHYVYIGAAMKILRDEQTLWDETDGFFYDLLRFPDGSCLPFKVRSLVGLIPLYAVERLEEKWIEPFDVFRENFHWFLKNRGELVSQCMSAVQHGDTTTHVCAVVDQNQLQRLLAHLVNSEEFLAPFGIRSLSRFHEAHPFTVDDASVGYEPAESRGFLKGGNSNWRGPVWFPTTFLLIESLRKLEKGFGGAVRVSLAEDGQNPPAEPRHEPHPPLADTRATEGEGAGASSSRARGRTLSGVALPPAQGVSLSGLGARIAERLIRIFLRDTDGYRPLYGPRGTKKAELFAKDPHWRDLILFHEYFNAENGEGLGASHQTGWTALIANLIQEWRG